jgi:hypothetical protein
MRKASFFSRSFVFLNPFSYTDQFQIVFRVLWLDFFFLKIDIIPKKWYLFRKIAFLTKIGGFSTISTDEINFKFRRIPGVKKFIFENKSSHFFQSISKKFGSKKQFRKFTIFRFFFATKFFEILMKFFFKFDF